MNNVELYILWFFLLFTILDIGVIWAVEYLRAIVKVLEGKK